MSGVLQNNIFSNPQNETAVERKIMPVKSSVIRSNSTGDPKKGMSIHKILFQIKSCRDGKHEQVDLMFRAEQV